MDYTQSKSDYMNQHEMNMNRLLCKIFGVGMVVEFLIVVAAYTGFFEMLSVQSALSWLVIILFMLLVYLFILKEVPRSGFIKYYAIICISIILFLMGKSKGLELGLIYSLIPIAGALYFNPHFIKICSGIGYLTMILALFIRAPLVRNMYQYSNGSSEWFWLNVVGKSMEYILVIVVLLVLSLRMESYIDELYRRNKAVYDIQDKVIGRFANLIEMRDSSTGKHVRRTSMYVTLIAKRLLADERYPEEMSKVLLWEIGRAAPLHDIGKIHVPDAVLLKEGPLTENEFAIVRRHTTDGRDAIDITLGGIEEDKFLDLAKEMALYHHERWDGRGYPTGLSGTGIPISARIMAVADVFDALISERCYKKAQTVDEAFEIIQSESGTHFDPVIVEVFCDLRSQIEAILKDSELTNEI